MRLSLCILTRPTWCGLLPYVNHIVGRSLSKKFPAELTTSQEDLNTLADTRVARMPQSRVNSAPCLYTAHTSEEGSEMSENSEGLTFDLFNTVTTLRNLMAFLEPLNISFRLVKNLLGWKICSLLCGVLLNVLFLTLSEEAWLLLGLLCVFALAILGYLKQSPRRTATSLALRRQRPSSESMADQQELALEMKAFPQPALTLHCESAHSLLCWGSYSDSAMFYGALLAVLYLLYTAPGSYTLVVTNSALFLWKGELHRVVRNMIFWRRSPKTTEGHFENREKTAFLAMQLERLLLSDTLFPPLAQGWHAAKARHVGGRPQERERLAQAQNISWEDLDETDDLDAEYDFKDAIEDDDDDEDYGMPLIIRRGALVGEIPNLHQKGQKRARRRRLHSSSNSGNCSRCQTSFSVLKKKKNCSNCGSSFCTRCCCKVQRSCLDTAAPEDQNEIVLVCTLCSVSLTKQE
ncbi:hypothetical protein ANANG_G00306230 [Anguilla anguilla]|uniref:Protrudin n=1 Tax=Anguilla anguilla TaxID=7936 RepID=A0A9D3RIQ1_ANGAN|nr:hypothetical protein ANANG_G00306230 [Anguilla anguilla]